MLLHIQSFPPCSQEPCCRHSARNFSKNYIFFPVEVLPKGRGIDKVPCRSCWQLSRGNFQRRNAPLPRRRVDGSTPSLVLPACVILSTTASVLIWGLVNIGDPLRRSFELCGGFFVHTWRFKKLPLNFKKARLGSL